MFGKSKKEADPDDTGSAFHVLISIVDRSQY